jgi:hypothetical protein
MPRGNHIYTEYAFAVAEFDAPDSARFVPLYMQLAERMIKRSR